MLRLASRFPLAREWFRSHDCMNPDSGTGAGALILRLVTVKVVYRSIRSLEHCYMLGTLPAAAFPSP